MLRFYSSGLSASAVQFSKSLQFFTGHESHQDACHAGISSCIAAFISPKTCTPSVLEGITTSPKCKLHSFSF